MSSCNDLRWLCHEIGNKEAPAFGASLLLFHANLSAFDFYHFAPHCIGIFLFTLLFQISRFFLSRDRIFST